ncbi:MAG: hypothetical protein ACM3NF_09405 [Gemmatimonadota bacterium]
MTRAAGRNRKPRRGAFAAGALLAAGLAAFAAGCAGRSLATGTVPFPADKPVFVDGEGRPLRELPAGPEPLRLVVLDFPWCPPCAEAWSAALAASASLPPGSLRVYRILFDRERFFTRSGVSVVPPLRAAARAEDREPASRTREVVTLTAIPGAFREEYEVRQAPVILLLSADGKVLRRWTGASASLSASIAEETRRSRGTDQDSSVSPPP